MRERFFFVFFFTLMLGTDVLGIFECLLPFSFGNVASDTRWPSISYFTELMIMEPLGTCRPTLCFVTDATSITCGLD